jgi:D-alanyl-D-alanine dipeptidase
MPRFAAGAGGHAGFTISAGDYCNFIGPLSVSRGRRCFGLELSCVLLPLRAAVTLTKTMTAHQKSNRGNINRLAQCFGPLSGSVLAQLLFLATVLAQATAPFRIAPVRPVDELRAEALKAEPPHETGNFRKPDLVEVNKLDHTIRLDIRYATANNFLGTPVYSEAHAFLERPAAEALVRVSHALKSQGYGLLIHDAYRPWYVTKIFWDAMPHDKHQFVADPREGSRHNRGCAIDLTLYDLKSGLEASMPSGYDEMTPRAFSNYKGGTDEENRHRAILRNAMQKEGFTQLPGEWWHFDYKDWKEYPILNVSFEDVK